MPTVTAVRAAGFDRVAVDVDGSPWRTLPLDVVVRARLGAGVELDRPTVRRLRRELRRAEALRTATRALRVRDRTRAELEERLARAAAPSARGEALETLANAGFVDDERFARSRASALAGRDYGDAAIAADLGRRGVPPEAIAAALADLEPETTRAARVAARRGADRATGRYLSRRGFGDDAVEAVVVTIADEV